MEDSYRLFEVVELPEQLPAVDEQITHGVLVTAPLRLIRRHLRGDPQRRSQGQSKGLAVTGGQRYLVLAAPDGVEKGPTRGRAGEGKFAEVLARLGDALKLGCLAGDSEARDQSLAELL